MRRRRSGPTRRGAPNRRFVIECRNVHFSGDTTRRVDFNVVLHENGEILTQYRNIADDGRERGNSATIGIESHTGTDALRFAFNQTLLASGADSDLGRATGRRLRRSRSRSWGHVRDAEERPVVNANGDDRGDADHAGDDRTLNGFYSFERMPEGTYTATAGRVSGLHRSRSTEELVVSEPVTLDFVFPPQPGRVRVHVPSQGGRLRAGGHGRSALRATTR